MNGELAQIIFLVSYGNAYLHNNEPLIADHSSRTTFQFVSSIDFIRYDNNQNTNGQVVARSASQWFEFLRSMHASRLWNISFKWTRKDIPEHIAVAFSGGVPSAIQVDLPSAYELWVPYWKTGGPEKKPWIIEYRGQPVPKSLIGNTLPISEAKNKLRKAVTRALELSRRSEFDAGNWTDWFSQSLEMLDSRFPKAPYHPDMLPDAGFSMDARQLMAAAAQAYVFGGMGSWNDMGFENPQTQKEYEEITLSLYDAVKNAIILASNSFSLS